MQLILILVLGGIAGWIIWTRRAEKATGLLPEEKPKLPLPPLQPQPSPAPVSGFEEELLKLPPEPVEGLRPLSAGLPVRYGSPTPPGIPQESNFLFRSPTSPAESVDPSKLAEMRDFFYTHYPSEWYMNPSERAYFQAIYGEQALADLDATHQVPENIDPNFVIPYAGYRPTPRYMLSPETGELIPLI